MSKWIAFDWPHLQELSRGVKFFDSPEERVCPACHVRSVRAYVYESERAGQSTYIGYTWCASCDRCAGSTSPKPPDLTFTDPLLDLPADKRRRLLNEPTETEMLDYLDRLWEEGVLPQRFFRG